MLASMQTVAVAGRVMRLSRHAIERYVERVKPMLELEQAADELGRLLGLAELSGERPAWACGQEGASGWVLLADGIAFPTIDNEIVTCLTRGEVGAELRVLREPRGDRERRSRKRRKQHGKVAREERRRARAAREAMGDG